MANSATTTRRALRTGLLSSLCVLTLLFVHASFTGVYASEKFSSDNLFGPMLADSELNKQLHLAEQGHRFLEQVKSKVANLHRHQLFLESVRDLPAEDKISAFLQGLRRAEGRGIDTESVIGSYLVRRQKLIEELNGGAISGKVSGELTTSDRIQMMAFDEYGFLAGMTVVDRVTRSYTIPDLAPGDYYLVSRTRTAEKFYLSENGATLSETPTASKVSLRGRDVSDINLDLSAGLSVRNSRTDLLTTGDASITGSINGPDGAGLSLALVLAFDAESAAIGGLGLALLGGYEILDLDAGTYIVFADSYFDLSIAITFSGFPVEIDAESLLGEYYENARTAAEATPIVLGESEARTGIDFTLETGGGISGDLTDEDGAALDSVFVIAIPAIDFENLPPVLTDVLDLGVTVTDDQGHYNLTGLTPGAYFVRTLSLLNANFSTLLEGALLGKHAGRVLDEYFGDVQNIFAINDATPVVVTGTDITTDIDFELELAGGISGEFIDTIAGGGPVDGEGIVIVFNAESGLPELAFDFNPVESAYEVRPLPDGDFKLLAFVDSETVVYLPQFYNGKPDLESADPVTVTTPNVTTDTDFGMIQAGMIDGVVAVPTAKTSTQNELEIIVVAFNSTSGELAGTTTADTLTQQYSIAVPAGDYKVGAFVGAEGIASTYHGGGTSFDDANSTTISVAFGATTQADINLAVGNGEISGTVTDSEGLPIPGVLILAYDVTGHAVSAGASGFDVATGEPFQNPGEYHIRGLVSGSYFVRTFSLFQILSLVEDVDLGGGEEGGDPLTAILALFGGDSALLGGLDLEVFADMWYDNQPIEIDLEEFDPFSLVFGLFFGGGDPTGIVPFFSPAPSGAASVNVSSPGQTTDINFTLQRIDLGDLLTDVEDEPRQDVLPERFQLSQNYPNPFNPSTVIEYSIPRAAEVTLRVYNVLGQRIRTLFEGRRERGVHSVQWDGLNDKRQPVAAGLYFMRLETEGLSLSRKMLLVK